MNCTEVQSRLSASLDAAVDPNESGPMDAHLQGCTPCRQRRGQLGAVRQVLRSIEAWELDPSAQKALGAELVERVSEQVHRSRRRRFGLMFLGLGLVVMSAVAWAQFSPEKRNSDEPADKPPPPKEIQAPDEEQVVPPKQPPPKTVKRPEKKEFVAPPKPEPKREKEPEPPPSRPARLHEEGRLEVTSRRAALLKAFHALFKSYPGTAESDGPKGGKLIVTFSGLVNEETKAFHRRLKKLRQDEKEKINGWSFRLSHQSP